MRIFALTAVTGEAVALTQPPGMPGVGDAHPVDVMSRSATVVLAWNVDVVFLPVLRRTMLNFPDAFVRAVNRVALPFSSIVTRAPATGPDCTTEPVNFTSRFFALTCRRSVTVPFETKARVSTVAAGFGAPVPDAYGVVIAFH